MLRLLATISICLNSPGARDGIRVTGELSTCASTASRASILGVLGDRHSRFPSHGLPPSHSHIDPSRFHRRARKCSTSYSVLLTLFTLFFFVAPLISFRLFYVPFFCFSFRCFFALGGFHLSALDLLVGSGNQNLNGLPGLDLLERLLRLLEADNARNQLLDIDAAGLD